MIDFTYLKDQTDLKDQTETFPSRCQVQVACEQANHRSTASTFEHQSLRERREKADEGNEVTHQGESNAVVAHKQPTHPIKIVSASRHFGGLMTTVQHWSRANNCDMMFNIFIPQAQVTKQPKDPYPVLYFLSGLEGTHSNAPQKCGFGPYAKKYNIAMIFPDTSPRDTGIQGVCDDWTWGDGASYYVDATTEKYRTHFNMFTYINEELPRVAAEHFPVSLRNKSITGYSMGGHGAIVSQIRTNNSYKSVSAFSPISNPSQSELCMKGYEQFFGSADAGKDWDSTRLIASGNFVRFPLLVDVGTADPYLHWLHVYELIEVAGKAGLKIDFRPRDHYDHSFWQVSTIIQEHIEFHSRFLNAWAE